MNWYLAVMTNYGGFSGRARRTEFWMFNLVYLVVYIGVFLLSVLMPHMLRPLFQIVLGVFALAHLVPSLAVTSRRLHDTGRSGWWYFIILIPVIGAIILLVFVCMDSEPGTNIYGPNPKGGGLAY